MRSVGAEVTPISLNKKVISLFLELSTLDADEPIQAKLTTILVTLKENTNLINSATFAMLFNKLSELDNHKQALAKELILFSINYTNALLSKKPKGFQGREIGQILGALPKLPVAWREHEKFISRVIRQLKVTLKESEEFDDRQLINILGTLAKLGFPLKEPLPLIFKLLKKLKLDDEKINRLESSPLGELWQFCVFAKSQFNHEKITALFECVDTALKQNPQKRAESSESHLSILRFLKEVLTKEYADALEVEYVVGAYCLDIAILSLKLDLEIDGRHHYREGRLIRNHNFRDFILKAYDNWITVRISLEEWKKLRTNTDKLNYLKEKLTGFEQLFKSPSPENARAIAKLGLLEYKESSSRTPSKIISQKNSGPK